MEKIAERIVIKVGSRSITRGEYGLNTVLMGSLAWQISQRRKMGNEIAVVSSGAVGAGRRLLGDTNGDLIDKQVAAIYGEPELISAWREAFREHDILAGQLLLTGTDLENPRVPLLRALKKGIPIINANDPVNDEEMRHYLIAADNDRLARYVTYIINADKLILLTDMPGVLDSSGNVIETITSQKDLLRVPIMGRSSLGTGGMRSKLDVAWSAAKQMVRVTIADAREKDVILKAARGERVGTTLCLAS